MSASNHLQSGILNQIFRGQPFQIPTNISIALTTDVPSDSDTGATISEVNSFQFGVSGDPTGYSRISIANPQTNGSQEFALNKDGNNDCVIQNVNQHVFPTALIDWGFISGVAILDSPNVGEGNVLFKGELLRQRPIFEGDNMKLNANDVTIGIN